MTYLIDEQDSKGRDLSIIVHALNLISCFTGLTGLIAVIIAYIKRGDLKGSAWKGHMTYAIRTFWIGLLAAFIGGLLTFIGIGFLILLAVGLWYLIRSIFALLKAFERKPIPDPQSWLI